MKYIKTFETKKENKIELVGYPEGNIIRVTKDEFEKLQHTINPSTDEEFDIRWDDEVDYEESCYGQWRFNNEEEDEIEKWLELYRTLGDVEAIKNIRKYNL